MYKTDCIPEIRRIDCIDGLTLYTVISRPQIEVTGQNLLQRERYFVSVDGSLFYLLNPMECPQLEALYSISKWK